MFTVGIVGLGLIGGSLAKAYSESGVFSLVAFLPMLLGTSEAVR